MVLDGLGERLWGWARHAAAAALTAGGRPVPRHIGFIMDGNRRFAEARQLRKAEGHVHGYRRLIAALEWCLELGVACVSVYAFSIDNYRRSGEEVATLMRLAEEKLAHLLQECEVLQRHGVRVRVVGDLSLAPAGVRAAAARIEAATAHHDRAVLNLCFSYTASEELQRALDSLAALQHGAHSSSSCGGGGDTHSSAALSVGALEEQLYTRGCPPVDLLVRTSGETRLSDFLLWQSRHALLVFTRVLWPEFGFLDLVSAVQQYQRQHAHLQRLRAVAEREEAAAAAAVAGGGSRSAAAAQPAAWQQLLPVRLGQSQAKQRRRGSPCSIASPAAPSSPSSRSEGSQEEAASAALAAAMPAGPLLSNKQQDAAQAQDGGMTQ